MDTNGRLPRGVLPKEVELLLYLIGQEKSKQMDQNLNRQWLDMDWALFLDLARHHRVFSITYMRVRALDGLPIPTKVVHELQQEYKLNTFEMMHLSGEMARLSKQLTEELIPCLFLKGPILAIELYGDLSLRSSCDLDVLIPLKDLERAEDLLLNQGYIKDDYFSTAMNDWKWRHHHITFAHPIRGIKVELHWRLNPGPSIEPNFNQLWERKRTRSSKGAPIYFLGREDLFLFLISHGARHGWSRLRWLVDIDRLSKQAIDWHILGRLLRDYGLSQVAGQALILCKNLLNTPMQAEMLVLMKTRHAGKLAADAMFYIRQMVNLHTEPVPEDVAKYHKRHLFSLMGIRNKLLFMINFLHPYPIDAETLPLPKSLHFLYFPLRPLLWVWRTTRKHVIHRGN